MCFLLICGLAWQACIDAHADNIRYRPVSQEIIEKRLESYAGNNPQRETTLKQMFAEAGCDEPHLSEQAVKGSKAAERYLRAAGAFRPGDHCRSTLRSRGGWRWSGGQLEWRVAASVPV